MCVWLMLSAVETRLLYANHEPEGALTDEELAEELATLCVRYLGLEQADAPRSANRPKASRSAKKNVPPATLSAAADGESPIKRRAANSKTNRRRKRRRDDTSTG